VLIELCVDQRCVHGSVPQHVGYIFDGTASIDDPARQGVAQGVAASMLDAGGSQCPTNKGANSVNPDGLVVGCL
jgi:hypothetical protein